MNPENIAQNGEDRIRSVMPTSQKVTTVTGCDTQACDLCDRSDVLLEQDHDHRTDLCRGRVCHSCNLLIGRFDRPIEEIERFLEYLSSWQIEHATRGGESYTEYMRVTRPKVRAAMAAYSDTVHGRFIEHMDLAREWLTLNGRGTTERQLLRTMDRLTLAQLRAALGVVQAERVA